METESGRAQERSERWDEIRARHRAAQRLRRRTVVRVDEPLIIRAPRAVDLLVP